MATNTPATPPPFDESAHVTPIGLEQLAELDHLTPEEREQLAQLTPEQREQLAQLSPEQVAELLGHVPAEPPTEPEAREGIVIDANGTAWEATEATRNERATA